MPKGMGFKAAQQEIAEKEGVPMKNAGAILASSSRKASPAAKAANPNLKKVKSGKPVPAPKKTPKKSSGMNSAMGQGFLAAAMHKKGMF